MIYFTVWNVDTGEAMIERVHRERCYRWIMNYHIKNPFSWNKFVVKEHFED